MLRLVLQEAMLCHFSVIGLGRFFLNVHILLSHLNRKRKCD